MKERVQTTTDCLTEARHLLNDAKKVETRAQHVNFWDNKVELLHIINNAFETGYFTGKAYDELQEAKTLLLTAETIAGDRARETYTREL